MALATIFSAAPEAEQCTNTSAQGTTTMLRLGRDALTPNTRPSMASVDLDADLTPQQHGLIEQELLDAVPPRQDFWCR